MPSKKPEFGAILEAASESILVTDANLDRPGPAIVYVNPEFERMTGWSFSEIEGQTPRVLQGEKTDLSIFSDMREILQSGGRWEGLTVNYRKDGSDFYMEWSITPLMGGDGRPEYYVAVQRDVTARIEAERQIEEARQAAQDANRRKLNLQRYFSPRTVEILAERDKPLGALRRENVAVLLVDIVGFTGLSEAMQPERVVALLRSFYRRIAGIVFDLDGTIEHFAGDSILAVFGAHDDGSNSASRALECGRRIKAEIGRWSAKREAARREPIRIGISAHYGLAVLGDIGTADSMSFTVIGDTVNVASRVQGLCRSLKRRFLVTSELVEQVRLEHDGAMPSGVDLQEAGTHHLRGRTKPITVLVPIDK